MSLSVKKFFLGTIIAIVVLIVGMLLFLILNINTIIKHAINTAGPEVLNVPVSVESVSVSPFSGLGTLNNLSIGNPPGFTSTTSFFLREVHVAVDLKSLSSEVLIVKKLLIDGARLTIEQKNYLENNLKDLLNGISTNNSDNNNPDNNKAADDNTPPPVRFIINEFDFKSSSLTLIVDGMGRKTIELPQLELHGIGMSEGGLRAGDAVKQLMGPVINLGLEQAVTSGLLSGSSSVQGLTESVKQGANDIADSAKDLFNSLGSSDDSNK